MSKERTSRRQEQNRLAQRSFRRRKRDYLQELERKASEVDQLNSTINNLQMRVLELEAINLRLQQENKDLPPTRPIKHYAGSAFIFPDLDPNWSAHGDPETLLSICPPSPCLTAPPCPRSRWTRPKKDMVRRLDTDI